MKSFQEFAQNLTLDEILVIFWGMMLIFSILAMFYYMSFIESSEEKAKLYVEILGFFSAISLGFLSFNLQNLTRWRKK